MHLGYSEEANDGGMLMMLLLLLPLFVLVRVFALGLFAGFGLALTFTLFLNINIGSLEVETVPGGTTTEEFIGTCDNGTYADLINFT